MRNKRDYTNSFFWVEQSKTEGIRLEYATLSIFSFDR